MHVDMVFHLVMNFCRLCNGPLTGLFESNLYCCIVGVLVMNSSRCPF
ncbi:unnamed protein product [Schistosoma margrebowiei]|uniref:Uncharacterized protein n=1 Tax=Schistosoma margrebowiei TaxID=48269 RepID=A0A3P7XLI5_9TREM|nr:unnamed protein product [Schistosoma margrebowiei]